jgi:hypothetical protein
MVDCGLSQNNAPSAEGGALYIGPGNSSLLDCEVSGNWAQKGGGIRTKSAKLDIFDSFIHGNTAQFGSGGGMYIELGHTRLESSQVGFNVADQDQAASAPQGGGIHAIGSICPAAASLTIRNTIIGGNQADGTPPDISTGGGLFGLHMPVTLTGCTLALNFADEGGGMHLTSSVPIRPAELRNTIFWSNSAATGVGMQVRAANGYAVNVNFCDVQGGSAGISVGGTSTLNFGVGNLNVNPQFEQPAGQFGILPGSPCINLGDPAFVPQPGETDFEGDTRLLYGRVDVGADEETGQ